MSFVWPTSYFWNPSTDLPSKPGTYLVKKRHHNGEIVKSTNYWSGYGWRTRAQILEWMEIPE
jgi:hypothetical protein